MRILCCEFFWTLRSLISGIFCLKNLTYRTKAAHSGYCGGKKVTFCGLHSFFCSRLVQVLSLSLSLSLSLFNLHTNTHYVWLSFTHFLCNLVSVCVSLSFSHVLSLSSCPFQKIHRTYLFYFNKPLIGHLHADQMSALTGLNDQARGCCSRTSNSWLSKEALDYGFLDSGYPMTNQGRHTLYKRTRQLL